MNRYFYVPVMDDNIKHDGVSLRDHLKVVDKELYDFENVLFDNYYDFSLYDGLYQARLYNHSLRRSEKVDSLFRKRNIPRFIVVVYNNEKGFHEMSSKEGIDPVDIDNISCYEMNGIDTVEVFVDNPAYTPIAREFFKTYEENKDLLGTLDDKPKMFSKFRLFCRRNK